MTKVSKKGATRPKDGTTGPAAAAPDAPGLGAGGELQHHGGDPLTTNHGVPLSDHQNSLRAGTRGPTLLGDFALRSSGLCEKIFHFDHQRIPERIVLTPPVERASYRSAAT